ncbi:hypothetical protein BH09GEM1_BH09GEM1_31920 [soil metagenome]
MLTRWLVALTISRALAPYPGAVEAQTRSGQLSGTVVDRATGAGVPEAEIKLVDGGRQVMTDSAGDYAFPDLPTGIVRFVVRARGFPVTRVAVALLRGERLSRLIELDSSTARKGSPQVLPGVAVADAAPPAPRYVDFARRRLIGRGQYLAQEELDKGGYASLQDAMRGLRGVNVECGGGDGCAIRMARAPMRCSPEYIVDERVDNTFGPSTPIRDIVGIEVYTGPSDVPGEFAGRNAGCGVIVVWTRSGPSPKRP